ncbi:MAG: PAP/fibrillin family protein [Cyanobacteria bacterium J06623_7]
MTRTDGDLKTKLLNQIENLGQERSLLPFSAASIDATITQLENTNPILEPLLADNFPALIGDWQLIYASNGTVLTRPLAEITNFLGNAMAINKIWQSLTVQNDQIMAQNQALIKFPLLGIYRLAAEGIWRSQTDQRTAMVSFDAFTIQAVQFLSQSDWSLPELKIPVLDLLQNEASWITSYLDEDTRIGRGATGNVFVFRR